MSQIFDELVEQSGLSPLFARRALERAVKRAGFEPERLTRADVKAAMPEIEQTIRTFMPKDVDAAIARLKRLGR